jgi:hypothetical protein
MKTNEKNIAFVEELQVNDTINSFNISLVEKTVTEERVDGNIERTTILNEVLLENNDSEYIIVKRVNNGDYKATIHFDSTDSSQTVDIKYGNLKKSLSMITNSITKI